jgi:BirA family biotin operon repressor/biotin-[acetyl-CoA-carboxylase] ligase
LNDLDAGIVLMLKSSDRYITRGEISAELDVTDDEVLSAVSGLCARGYRIDDVPGQGYRLVDVPAVLDGCELRSALKTHVMGREILPFGRVTSTNDIAFSLAEAGSGEGTIVIAEEQTRGKGRLGRGWHSPPGLGLWFSLILRPAMEPYQSSTVSLAVALAAASILRERYRIDARIKWPNDVLVGSKKICGILTEAEFSDGGVEFVIVGLGVNVKHDPGDFPPALRETATSIRIETSADVGRVYVFSALLAAVEEKYGSLCAKGFEGIKREILPLSSLMGNLTRVKTGKGVVEGIAVDIDETGALVLRTETGMQEKVLAGEATLIRSGGPS